MCSIDLVQLSVAGGTVLTAFFTYLIYAIARSELKASNKVSSHDFQHKIKGDFYTSEMYKIFFLLENDLLEFKSEEDKTNYFFVRKLDSMAPLFSVVETIVEDFRISREKRIMPNYFIDQYLLNHFTDIEMLRREGIFSWQDIYDGYSFYIQKVYENKVIQAYVEFSREGEENANVFQEVIDLYERFKG